MSLALAGIRAALLPGAWARNDLWRRARAVPSLDLRFADNKSLTDAVTGQSLVTFTRASSATYVGSDGLIKTAVTNLLLRSEEFDNASWALGAATVTANAIAAPSGSLAADQLIETTATANHEASQSFTPSANTSYTLSCYLKAATASTCGLRFSAGLTGSGVICSVDLVAKTATVTSGTGTATIVTLADGWFRVSLTATASASPSNTFAYVFRSLGVAGSTSNSIYIWGAQLEQSSTVGEYIPTTSTINSAPRFDHNPTTGESLGLLVEEQRTNLLLSSATIGGSNWQSQNNIVVETNTTDVTDPSRQNTATKLSYGLSNSQSLQIVTLTAVVHTLSIWARVASGTATLRLKAFLQASPYTIIGQADFTVSTTWQRFSVTTSSTTAAAYCYAINLPNAGTTLYVWGAQLEAGAFPTSYIPTTTAAVTRSADVASITGSNFTSWYRQDEGTVFVAGIPFTNAQGTFVSVDDGTTNQRWQVRYTSDRRTRLRFVSTGNNFDDVSTAGIFAAGTALKMASCAAVNNQSICLNGENLRTIAATAMPVATQLPIGTGPFTDTASQTISRLTYFPRRLPDTTLQTLTQ